MSVTKLQPYQGSYLMPSFEHATVADAMHPGILSCGPDTTATDVARMMATHHVHCLAVSGISRDQHGESLVWGIASDLDLVKAQVDGGPEQTAGALARQPIVTVDSSMPLRDAARVMLRNGASHVVVLDATAQRPVGVLSTLDIAGVLAWGDA